MARRLQMHIAGSPPRGIVRQRGKLTLDSRTRRAARMLKYAMDERTPALTASMLQTGMPRHGAAQAAKPGRQQVTRA